MVGGDLTKLYLKWVMNDRCIGQVFSVEKKLLRMQSELPGTVVSESGQRWILKRERWQGHTVYIQWLAVVPSRDPKRRIPFYNTALGSILSADRDSMTPGLYTWIPPANDNLLPSSTHRKQTKTFQKVKTVPPVNLPKSSGNISWAY